jgi:5-methylcytosine-specific restriction endonuclease McrA
VKSNGECEYLDPVTGKKCGSYYALEVDHVIALALGGATTLSNLRLLCKNHNAELGRQLLLKIKSAPMLSTQNRAF